MYGIFTKRIWQPYPQKYIIAPHFSNFTKRLYYGWVEMVTSSKRKQWRFVPPQLSSKLAACPRIYGNTQKLDRLFWEKRVNIEGIAKPRQKMKLSFLETQRKENPQKSCFKLHKDKGYSRAHANSALVKHWLIEAGGKAKKQYRSRC